MTLGKGVLLLPFGLQVPTTLVPALLYVVVSPLIVPMLVPSIPGTLLESPPPLVDDDVLFSFPCFEPFAFFEDSLLQKVTAFLAYLSAERRITFAHSVGLR